jgi:hypothetical protein
MKTINVQKSFRRVVQGLPLAGIIFANLMPIQPVVRHLLVAATLIWLQIVIVFEVFLNGK